MSHRDIDLSQQFDPEAELPEQRWIEKAELHPVPSRKPTRAEQAQVPREIYRASPALAEVVNLAIALGRPLLLQGDPGCGKTRLAHAVAYALGLPLEQATVKSTTRAQDLLYTFDAVRRLYDAQLAGTRAGALRGRAAERPVDPSDIAQYLGYGPFGRAIIRAQHGRRSVVLIDEIDKADLDFPNDLLHELDRLEFQVAELPGLAWSVPGGRADLRPIVFITHNEEKPLPPAFLRRCLFHYVDFPSADLDRILGQHRIDSPALRARAIQVVQRLRTANLAKKPGLSELLDWAGYLQAAGIAPERLDGESPPGMAALIKQREDDKAAREALRSMPPGGPA